MRRQSRALYAVPGRAGGGKRFAGPAIAGAPGGLFAGESPRGGRHAHDARAAAGRLRIRHELIELNTEHLRFLRAEAAQLLYVRGGGELSGGALDDLLEKTEGWAAALQLAAASLARSVDQNDVMQH